MKDEIYKKIIEKQKEYIAMLGKSEGDLALFARTHGITVPVETVEKGKQLRAEITELESHLQPVPAPLKREEIIGKDLYLVYDAINNEYEYFDSLKEAQEYIEELILDKDEGYHPDGSGCKIFILHQNVVYDVIDKKSNYKYLNEEDIPDGEDAEAWPYDNAFNEIWKHKFINSSALTSQEVEGEKEDWYCPKCGCFVDSRSVTFNEEHDLCGASVFLKPVESTANELQKLMDDICEWSGKTFANEKPYSKIKHLEKEVTELAMAIFHEHGNKCINEEFADCFMLLIGAAKLQGYTANDLLCVTREKLEVNKTREWGKPDENGVVEHIKPSPSEITDEEIMAWANTESPNRISPMSCSYLMGLMDGAKALRDNKIRKTK